MPQAKEKACKENEVETFSDYDASILRLLDDVAQESEGVDDASWEHNHNQQRILRDKLFTKVVNLFLGAHEKKIFGNKKYKAWFFAIIMAILCAIVFGGFGGILFLVLSKTDNSSKIIGVASIISGLVSGIIVLPKIIAEHLFPKDEDKTLIDLINRMQQEDQK